MTARDYRSLSEKEMCAKRWRLTREIANRAGDLIASGTEGAITRKFGGVYIRTLPCPHCGCAVSISKVHFADVEEITA